MAALAWRNSSVLDFVVHAERIIVEGERKKNCTFGQNKYKGQYPVPNAVAGPALSRGLLGRSLETLKLHGGVGVALLAVQKKMVSVRPGSWWHPCTLLIFVESGRRVARATLRGALNRGGEMSEELGMSTDPFELTLLPFSEDGWRKRTHNRARGMRTARSV